MGAVYKKELRSYFTNMTGYIAIALILMMTGIFAKVLNFNQGYPDFEYALPTVSLILMLAVPIITMRSFAEEKHQRTDLLLYTLPLSSAQIVMGKYLAMMTVFAIPSAFMLFIPLILCMYGTVNLLSAYAAILAFFLLCGAMVAICMFMSTLTESQVIAAVLGIAALVLCYAASLLAQSVPTTAIASFIAFTVLILLLAFAVYYFVRDYWISFTFAVLAEGVMLIVYVSDSTKFSGLFQKFINNISIFDKLNSFISNQLVDITTLIYYLSIIVVFCFLTGQTVEKKRWS